nr:MAG TPA: nucelotide kinase [Bacteriophage sp.]
MPDMVNHPKHYNRSGRKECIEEMIDIWGKEKVAMWCEMTAYKYKYRIGLKDNPMQEQGKIDWYENKARELKASLNSPH